MEMDPTFDISPVGAASRGFGTVPFFSDSPRTNGMVERFNGRIVSEVLAITIYSHDQLEQLLRGFNAAYNARRQRVLEGQTPDQVVAERLTAKPALAKDKPSGRAGPCDIAKARLIAESAKEVSQPDNYEPRTRARRPWRIGSAWGQDSVEDYLRHFNQGEI